jgi:hypothetical protein
MSNRPHILNRIYFLLCISLFLKLTVYSTYTEKIQRNDKIVLSNQGAVITVIYITKNILIHKCNKQYTNKQFAEIRLVHKY